MEKKLATTFCTRQHMNAKDFELYYYEDVNLSNVEPHIHDYYEFYFFLEGDITMYIDSIPHRLSPGDVLLIPCGCPHYLTCADISIPYRRFVLWVSAAYYQQLKEIDTSYIFAIDQAQQHKSYLQHFDTVTFNAIQHKITRLLEEQMSDRFGKAAKVTLCINDLLLHMSRSYYELRHRQNPDEGQSLFEALLQIIERDLSQDVSLDSLANQLFVSKYYISRIFKKRLGLSIYQYIIKRRLMVCLEAFLCGGSISQACRQYGFKDYSNFYRAFVKEYGMSPQEYKNEHSKVHPQPLEP